MISPARRLPAASILQVSAIAVRRAIDIDHRNTAMQFFTWIELFFLFYWLLFYRPLTGAPWDKNTCAFFCRCIESTRTDPSYPPIYFSLVPPVSLTCFGMISDEGSGGAIVMVVVGGNEDV